MPLPTNKTSSRKLWGREIDFPSSRSLRSSSHVIGGKYPCRSIAFIPKQLLGELKTTKSKANILDPFMGSGTTAIETIQKGFSSYGLEVDPYARLISNLSVHSFTDVELNHISAIQQAIADKFESTIPNQDLKPDAHNISYWFSLENFNNLLKLKTLIFDLTRENPHVQRFFLAVLADIIRASSKAERQSLKPYISKRFIKQDIPVLPSFLKAFKTYYAAIAENKNIASGKINWLSGDATCFTSAVKMDAAITSPPYINAMDYVRCIKLESSWIGTGNDTVFSNVRKLQVGEGARVRSQNVSPIVQQIADPFLSYLKPIDISRYNISLCYFQDMHDNLEQVYNALNKGAPYHLIVGNSVIRGNLVPTHEIIARLGEHLGYEWHDYFKYPIKDHRTSLPRNGKGGKINEEHVITLRKRG